jgi:hypothetical protein
MLGVPRRVAGGYVVDVARATDSTDRTMRLRDGSTHPAGCTGYRWTAPVCNLVDIDIRYSAVL